MVRSGTRCVGMAVWAVPVALLVVSATLLLMGSPVEAGLPLALDAVLLCLAYQLCVVLARPASHGATGALVRWSVEAVPPRLRESDAGMPGRAWPRAPGRGPR